MEMYESYLAQIQRYPLLDAEKEASLSRKVEKGDRQAYTDLVNCNLRLVVSVAKRFSCDKVSVMDLVQEGNMGLMIAAEKYHYSFKTRFSTYAYTWILQYMLRYLYNRTAMIAVPHRKEEMLRRLRKIKNAFRIRYGRDPSVHELAAELNIDEFDIRTLLSYDYTYSSLDVPCTEEGDVTVGELLPDEAYSPEQMLVRKEMVSEVGDLLQTLPAAERMVIFNRYNFEHELHVKTLRELSIELDVSAETIRQMEIRAVRRMRRLLLARRPDAERAELTLG